MQVNNKDLLRQNHIKITKARTTILDIIMKSDSSISAEDIYNRCVKQGEDVNLSTVYRSLDLFEDKDIINKLDLGEGRYTYRINNHSHMHTLKCSLCHKEIEVPCPMYQVEELVRNKTGFVLTDHQLVLKGICEECKKSKS